MNRKQEIIELAMQYIQKAGYDSFSYHDLSKRPGPKGFTSDC